MKNSRGLKINEQVTSLSVLSFLSKSSSFTMLGVSLERRWIILRCLLCFINYSIAILFSFLMEKSPYASTHTFVFSSYLSRVNSTPTEQKLIKTRRWEENSESKTYLAWSFSWNLRLFIAWKLLEFQFIKLTK